MRVIDATDRGLQVRRSGANPWQKILCMLQCLGESAQMSRVFDTFNEKLNTCVASSFSSFSSKIYSSYFSIWVSNSVRLGGFSHFGCTSIDGAAGSFDHNTYHFIIHNHI